MTSRNALRHPAPGCARQWNPLLRNVPSYHVSSTWADTLLSTSHVLPSFCAETTTWKRFGLNREGKMLLRWNICCAKETSKLANVLIFFFAKQLLTKPVIWIYVLWTVPPRGFVVIWHIYLYSRSVSNRIIENVPGAAVFSPDPLRWRPTAFFCRLCSTLLETKRRLLQQQHHHHQRPLSLLRHFQKPIHSRLFMRRLLGIQSNLVLEEEGWILVTSKSVR